MPPQHGEEQARMARFTGELSLEMFNMSGSTLAS
jgi:hypothetical protein